MFRVAKPLERDPGCGELASDQAADELPLAEHQRRGADPYAEATEQVALAGEHLPELAQVAEKRDQWVRLEHRQIACDQDVRRQRTKALISRQESGAPGFERRSRFLRRRGRV